MSWPTLPLGELVSVKGGKRLPKGTGYSDKNTDHPYIRVTDFRNNSVKLNDLVYIDSEVQRAISRYTISSDDVYISIAGTIGLVGTIPKELDGANLTENAAKLIIHDKSLLDKDYLVRFLSTKGQTQIKERKKVTSQPKLALFRIEEIEIPLPPLAEQKRIAAILDKADAIRRKRQQAIQLADEFLRSVFLDMFGDPVTNPKGWEPATLGDMIHFAKDGPHVSPKYSEEGIPFLSTRHVKPSGVVWEDLKYVTQEEADLHWKKCKPEKGDVLYTKGGTTGIACPVDFKKDFAVWVHVALLRPNVHKVNYVWLSYMLNSKYCYLQSQKHTRGATNKDLGLTRMVDIKMFCPPISEQEKFVEAKNRIESLIKKGQKFNRSSLFDSLSQKAFAGEL